MDAANPHERFFRRYATAVLAVALVLAFQAALGPMTGVEAPFLLFLGAVLFAAWYGGVWPGFLATILSAAVVVYFVPPYHHLHVTDPNLYRVLQFVAEGAFISVLSGL